MISNISYTPAAFQDLNPLINQMRTNLIKYDVADDDFDSIVGRGLSGSLVIPHIARVLGKEWAIIRKPSESSHAIAPFEGTIGEKWLFVDDFLSTGNTLRETIRGVTQSVKWYQEWRSFLITQPLFIGAYQYDKREYMSYMSAARLRGMGII